jgi:CheY-like chemotaxis protein
MSDKTILLVEDDSEDQFLMKEAFNDNGIGDSLRFADNGEAAIEYLNTLNPADLPALIVMDLNMPRMNGRETLTFLKQHAVYNIIPVIIYSTSINDIERIKCKEIGAAAYIIKPTTFTECQEIAKWFHKIGSEEKSEESGEGSMVNSE